MRIAVVVAGLVAALTSARLAAAQAPGLTPPADPEQPAYPPPPPQYVYPQAYPAPSEATVAPVKSESTATLLAIGATTGGFLAIGMASGDHDGGSPTLGALGVGLLLIGPSAGHIYAGENGHAIRASLLRSAGVLAMLVGAVTLTSVAASDCEFECSSSQRGDRRRGAWLLGIGAAVYVGTTIYDLVDAGSAARRENTRHARAMMFAPSVVGTRSGGAAPAVSLAGRF
jgi:hypothetical protein